MANSLGPLLRVASLSMRSCVKPHLFRTQHYASSAASSASPSSKLYKGGPFHPQNHANGRGKEYVTNGQVVLGVLVFSSGFLYTSYFGPLAKNKSKKFIATMKE